MNKLFFFNVILFLFLYFQTLNTLKSFLGYIVFGIVRNKSNCTRKIGDLIFTETNHNGNECKLLVNSGYVTTFPLSLCHMFFLENYNLYPSVICKLPL